MLKIGVNELTGRLLFGTMLINSNNCASAMQSKMGNQSRVSSSQLEVDKSILKKIIKQRRIAAEQENWKTLLSLILNNARS